MNKSPHISKVILRQIMLRLFLPLFILSIMAIVGIGYWSEDVLEKKQYEIAQTHAKFIDFYLDQAGRILDSLARSAEDSDTEELNTFMQGVWEAYVFFDTLYFLDQNHKVKNIVPFDSRYLGIDMSNMPDLPKNGNTRRIIISRPFISLRTGNPTVYMILTLSSGQSMIGELNLGSIQNDISTERDNPVKDMVFIIDQSGMLLAHPSSQLVKQQTNVGNIEIFRHKKKGGATLLYSHNRALVLGSSAEVKHTGWLVVVQVNLFGAMAPLIFTLSLTLSAFFVLWITLIWSIRKKLQQYIISPLVELSRWTTELASGEYDRHDYPVLFEATSHEVEMLVSNFKIMSMAVAERQAKLSKSDAQLRELVETSPLSMAICDNAFNVILVNRKFIELFGYNHNDVPTIEHWWPLAYPDTSYLEEIKKKWNCNMEKAIKTRGEIEPTESIVRCKDGSIRHIEFRLSSIGEMSFIIFSDVTEHIRAEESLRESEKRFRLISETMPVAAIVSRISDLQIVYANAASSVLFGLPADGFAGTRLPEIYAACDREKLVTLISSAEEINGVEFMGHRRDKTPLWVSLFIQPMKFGNDLCVLSVWYDLTEYKLAREAEKKADERLRQAQKMETIGTLAGGLAHDFNNVLGGIVGTVSIIKYRMNQGADITFQILKGYIETIEKSSQRAAEIVQQLLSISCKRESAFLHINLNDIIKNVMTICANTFDKSVELKSLPLPKPAIINADPVQIEQVLLNLCVNACHSMTIMRKDTDKQGGTLTVSLRNILADDHFCISHPEAVPSTRYCILSVQDTGIGMDSKTISKIFDPFFTTKDKGKGTGLGLAMVYNITHRHNGFIDVYSELRKASIFNIYLPCLEVDFSRQVENMEELSLCRGEGLILVIDDEAIMRDLAKEILEECGYTVITAENGREGVDVFAKEHKNIKLILLDMVMPKLSGRDAYFELKKIDPDLNVLLASGFRQDERVDEILQLGIQGFIQKPYTIENLSKAVKKII